MAIRGQATDIEIHAKEILKVREQLNQILANHSGQSLETIHIDTERDNFMDSHTAVEYGMVDKVLDSRSKEPVSE